MRGVVFINEEGVKDIIIFPHITCYESPEGE
jgi:hypothetical protein